jgi:hypothetical protein
VDATQVDPVVDLLLEPAVRHRAEAACFLLYTADDPLARAVVRRLRGRGGRAPRVVEALRVHGGRYYPLLGERRGLGTTGVPYDVSGHAFVAEAVLQGRVLHGSRADLAATLRPDPDGVAAVAARRGVRARRSAAWVTGLLDAWVGRDDPPPDDLVADLVEAIAVPAVRDAAWVRLCRATAGHDVRFWAAVLRRTPEDLVPHTAAVLAFAAWVAGDGALGWCAVDRAREVYPRHSLAGLVADMLTGAVAPSEWERARAAWSSAS